jgi:hypothetical protein
MKPQTPALNISKTGEWSDTTAYKLACDCHDNDHMVDMWLEVDPDTEFKDITISFHVQTTAPFWEKGFNRFKLIWQLLTTGYYKSEHHFILNEQTATNLITIIKKDLTKFKQI